MLDGYLGLGLRKGWFQEGKAAQYAPKDHRSDIECQRRTLGPEIRHITQYFCCGEGYKGFLFSLYFNCALIDAGLYLLWNEGLDLSVKHATARRSELSNDIESSE